LCEVDTRRFAISVIVGASDVVEMRELVNDCLNLLGVVRVVECKVTDVDLLGSVCWVDVCVGGATPTCSAHLRGATLAHVGAAVHDARHGVELLLGASVELCLSGRGAEPRVDGVGAARCGALNRLCDLEAGVLVPITELPFLAGRASRELDGCSNFRELTLIIEPRTLFTSLLALLVPLLMLSGSLHEDCGLSAHDISVVHVTIIRLSDTDIVQAIAVELIPTAQTNTTRDRLPRLDCTILFRPRDFITLDVLSPILHELALGVVHDEEVGLHTLEWGVSCKHLHIVLSWVKHCECELELVVLSGQIDDRVDCIQLDREMVLARLEELLRRPSLHTRHNARESSIEELELLRGDGSSSCMRMLCELAVFDPRVGGWCCAHGAH